MKSECETRIPNRMGKGAPLILSLCAIAWLAVSSGVATGGQWNGYEQIDFNVGGRSALLVVPKTPAPGKHWIWRTEFFGVDPQADIALLGEGVYVAYIGVGGLHGAPVALDAMDLFYDHVIKTYGLNRKTVLEGFSRGGLYALNWAIRHPERVAGIYLDAPVCDFKSWPGGGIGSQGRLVKMYGREWGEVLAAYKMTDEQARTYKGNPIDKNENLAPLVKAKVPILCVCGDMHDWVVPIEGNTLALEKRYKELGGNITVIKKPGAGHRPHSLPDPTPIVNFVLKYTTGTATEAKASNTFQKQAEYGPDKAIDGNAATRWATEGVTQAWLAVNLGKPKDISKVDIHEWAEGGERVQRFKLEYLAGDAWKTIFEGKTIGANFSKTFDPVKARVIRLNILQATEGPSISEISVK